MRELKDHQNIHPLENNKELNFTFACNICDAKFLRKKQLSNHMETHRHNVEPCSICGKIMKNVACLRSHMKNHTTTKDNLQQNKRRKTRQHAHTPRCLH